MITRHSLRVLLVLSIAVTACSSSSPSENGGPSATPPAVAADATPGTDLTACELVSGSDIEAALELDEGTAGDGEPRPLAPGDDPAASECEWSISDWGGLTVNVSPTTGAAAFAQASETIGDRGEALDIGDGSLWVDDIGRGYFDKGPVLILVQFLVLYGGRDKRAATIALGTAAINRLQAR
jgi:hypothetical protein